MAPGAARGPFGRREKDRLGHLKVTDPWHGREVYNHAGAEIGKVEDLYADK